MLGMGTTKSMNDDGCLRLSLESKKLCPEIIAHWDHSLDRPAGSGDIASRLN